MHSAITVLVLLFGLALIGAAVAQVINYPEWAIFTSDYSDTYTTAGVWQRFLLFGLAPLFAGLAITLYAVYKLSGKDSKSGRLLGMDESSAAL